jgi:hypothetical protein
MLCVYKVIELTIKIEKFIHDEASLLTVLTMAPLRVGPILLPMN